MLPAVQDAGLLLGHPTPFGDALACEMDDGVYPLQPVGLDRPGRGIPTNRVPPPAARTDETHDAMPPLLESPHESRPYKPGRTADKYVHPRTSPQRKTGAAPTC